MACNAEKRRYTLRVGQQPSLQRAYCDAVAHPGVWLRKKPADEGRRAVSVMVEITNHKPFAVFGSFVKCAQSLVQVVFPTQAVHSADGNVMVVDDSGNDALVAGSLDCDAYRESSHRPNRVSCAAFGGAVLGRTASATVIPADRSARSSRFEETRSTIVPSRDGVSCKTSSPAMP